MATLSRKSPRDLFNLLRSWLGSARGVVYHIGNTRGPHASFHREELDPWPIAATHVLKRNTGTVIEYIATRHSLDIRAPLERIVAASQLWTSKRDGIVEFSKIPHGDAAAARVAVDVLSQFTEQGLPEQRRLDLDLRIAEGATWLAQFPLLAEQFGHEHQFVIRKNLILWSMWALEAVPRTCSTWPLPSETEIFTRVKSGRGSSGGWLESAERGELANVISPRYVPDSRDTPMKLAIDEARYAGDLSVALPRIEGLLDELQRYVMARIRDQGDRTENLLVAVNTLEALIGSSNAQPAQEEQLPRRPREQRRDPMLHTASVPAWRRLKLRRCKGGDIALLDGKSFMLRGVKAYSFLRSLKKARGGPVKCRTLAAAGCPRPDRILKTLQRPLQKIIEAPRRGGEGYRML